MKYLKFLPDISNWNTSNVVNMSSLFHNCQYLGSLPEIGKWNISKVKDMSFMFHGCNKLAQLSYKLSGWNLNSRSDINKVDMY